MFVLLFFGVRFTLSFTEWFVVGDCVKIFYCMHILEVAIWYPCVQDTYKLCVLNMIVSADGVQMARGGEGGPCWKGHVICGVATPL